MTDGIVFTTVGSLVVAVCAVAAWIWLSRAIPVDPDICDIPDAVVPEGDLTATAATYLLAEHAECSTKCRHQRLAVDVLTAISLPEEPVPTIDTSSKSFGTQGNQ